MTTIEAIASAPRYVLVDDDARPEGPLCRDYGGEACVAVYGFTDRGAYEAFRLGAVAPSRPYPLVAGYLTRVFEGARVRLIVINAVGPDEALLEAVAAEFMLSAASDASPLDANRYQLSRVAGAKEYEVIRLSPRDAS